MNNDAWYWEILEELDHTPVEVTEWEADFLDNLLSKEGAVRKLSQSQKNVIEKMKEKYLA